MLCGKCLVLALAVCGEGLGLAVYGEGLGLAGCGEGLGLAILLSFRVYIVSIEYI